jgi:hypothetical protein
MKYLLTTLLSLMLAQPALAAKMVKGAVPVLPALQPQPAGIGANVQSNIQSSSSAAAAQGQEQGQSQQPSAGQANSAQNREPGNLPIKTSAGNFWGWLLIILAVLITAWMIFKPRKK